MTSLTDVEDYKEIIRLHLKRSGQNKGAHSLAAKAMRCHTSFLSQVLHGSMHITPDHAAALCEHWQLGEQESEYFLNLVMRDRAGTNALRSYHTSKLRSIRELLSTVSGRVSKSREMRQISGEG
jgi:hypothetical protein